MRDTAPKYNAIGGGAAAHVLLVRTVPGRIRRDGEAAGSNWLPPLTIVRKAHILNTLK